MLSDAALLALALVGLLLTVFIFLLASGFFVDYSNPFSAAEGNNERNVMDGRRRNRQNGLRKRKNKKKDKDRDSEQADDDQGQMDVAANVDDENAEPRALTLKELKREMKQQEREERRQLEESRREEQRRRDAQQDKLLRARREFEAKVEEKIQKEEKLVRLEIEKQEQKYSTWKQKYSADDKNFEERDGKVLEKIAQYIKGHPAITLAEVRSQFKLSTDEMFCHAHTLRKFHRIIGSGSDTDAFRCIDIEKLKVVANFVQRKGRFDIAEIAKVCVDASNVVK